MNRIENLQDHLLSRRQWLATATAATLLHSTRATASTLTDTLAETIPPLLAEHSVEGLAIAVIEKDAAPWSAAFGTRNSDTGQPFQNDTVVEAASLTKPVFAYRVLQLVDQGKLDLDAPITEYVDSDILSDDPRISQVTARLILSHQSGMPNQPIPDRKARFWKDVGEKFVYSGTGYVTLQRIVESITGEPLEQTLEENIFAPLGMTDSSVVWRDDYADRVAHGHHKKRGVLPKAKPQRANAAATLHTTIGDYAKFLSLFTTPYANETHRIRPETLTKMMHHEVMLAPNLYWGLGWGLQQIDGEDYFWHWGNNNNVFHHFTTGSVSQQRAIVILTNSQQGPNTFRPLLTPFNGTNQPALDWLKV